MEHQTLLALAEVGVDWLIVSGEPDNASVGYLTKNRE